MKKEQSVQILREESHIKGFSLIEVILSVALLGLVLTALIGSYLFGQESTVLSGSRGRAVLFAEEGLEVVKNIRDDDFTNLTDGTHGLAVSGGQWVFSGSSDVEDIFTREVIVSTVDANRKSIVSNVSWQQNAQRSGLVSLTTRLTNWMVAVSVIGDWSDPIEGENINISGSQNGFKIQVSGDYAYVVRNGGNPDFIVIDISDVDNPSIAASLNLSSNPRNIAVSGNYAYVVTTNNSDELVIVDISTPTSPSVIGDYNAPGNANMLGVYVVGNTAYLGRDSSGQDEFYIIDVSTPSSPTLTGSLELGADANEVYINGNEAYIASDDNSEELQVINITTPSSPTLLASLNLSTNDNAETITGFDDTVIIGRSTNDGFVHTIDVSTPSSPSELDSYSAGDDVNDIDLGNNNEYLFIVTDSNDSEFQVLDISNLSSISLLGSLDVDSNSNLNGVAYHSDKDRAFVVGDDNSAEFIVIEPQ